MRRVRSAGRYAISVGIFSIRRFIEDRCLIGASALSYTSIVSLVPLTAVALVIFSGFPIFSSVRERLLNLILDNFAPDVGDEAAKWFAFAATNAAQTTALGIVVLVASAILLLATIEDQLHLIFRVTVQRSWGQRLLVYWTVLTLGPLLLGVALSVSGDLDGWFSAAAPSLTGRFSPAELMPGTVAAARASVSQLLRLLPMAMEVLAITMLYCLIPQRTVRWSAGLFGAVVAVALLQVLKLGFSLFVGHLSTYNKVYGALAGVPIFLLWMYIFWIAVLLGAELTASLDRRARRGLFPAERG
jgi:membrane protein